MANINFPSSPTVSQIYSFGGRTWQYNGTGWRVVLSDATYTLTPSAGVVTINCSGGKDIVAYVSLDQNATLNLINGSEGQRIFVRVVQNVMGGWVLTAGSMIALSTDLPTMSVDIGANKRSYLGFIYYAASSKFDFISSNKGF